MDSENQPEDVSEEDQERETAQNALKREPAKETAKRTHLPVEIINQEDHPTQTLPPQLMPDPSEEEDK